MRTSTDRPAMASFVGAAKGVARPSARRFAGLGWLFVGLERM